MTDKELQILQGMLSSYELLFRACDRASEVLQINGFELSFAKALDPLAEAIFDLIGVPSDGDNFSRDVYYELLDEYANIELEHKDFVLIVSAYLASAGNA